MESTRSVEADRNTPVPSPKPTASPPGSPGCGMMEVVQRLTTQKIQELLVLCGIAHRSDEPIQEHITGIANYVQATRLADGIEGFTDPLLKESTSIVRTPPRSPAELRGSYRLLTGTPKRGRDDFSGMTSPNWRKRKTNPPSHDLGGLKGRLDASNHSSSITSCPTTVDTVTTDSATYRPRMSFPAHGTPENPHLVSSTLVCSAPMPGLDHSEIRIDHPNDRTHQSSPPKALTLGGQTHLPTVCHPAEAIVTMSSILWNCVKYNTMSSSDCVLRRQRDAHF